MCEHRILWRKPHSPTVTPTLPVQTLCHTRCTFPLYTLKLNWVSFDQDMMILDTIHCVLWSLKKTILTFVNPVSTWFQPVIKHPVTAGDKTCRTSLQPHHNSSLMSLPECWKWGCWLYVTKIWGQELGVKVFPLDFIKNKNRIRINDRQQLFYTG